MIDFKKEIALIISNALDESLDEIYKEIQLTKDENNGDYSFPCFILSKKLKKSPIIICEELKEKIDKPDFIDEIKCVSGYLNFYLKKEILIKEVCKEYEIKKEKYGDSDIGKNKTILIDYSSPNIAKPFHIGHLRSTVIGSSLYNIYKTLGYNVIGINHLGDYGTQFGKLIEAYKLWSNEYNIEENPIDELTKMYIRIR
jgi:arginyl-tRNA synthetase